VSTRVALFPNSPAFQINWHHGGLVLAGHTLSLQHEQNLLQVAASSFPGSQVITDFEPLGIVPDYWGDTTIQILYLLAETDSSHADLSTDRIIIRAVISDELGWQNRLHALKKAFPDNVLISVNTVVIDTTVSVWEVCERAFAAFDAGPINFEESSAELRSSAYPRLDRVIAFASACMDSSIEIIGHTDASGFESWNQTLSLRRANAVGDYIVRGGIHRARLIVSGAGSANPVADDGTHYGRSLNRRIEITWRGAAR